MKKVKFSLVILFISTYFLVTLPALLTIKLFPKVTRKFLAKAVSLYSHIVLMILGVKIELKGSLEADKSYFIVSNHMSYLDILIISRFMPTLFVTSMEMKKTPVLGQITTLAGCLFVERRSRDNILQEIEQIKEALESGINVTVFPEATSTNGEALLPFKRSLFEAAAKSEKEILPLTLNYESINNEKVNIHNRDLLCWYGDMTFVPHLLTLCAQTNIKISIEFNQAIETIGNSDTVVLRDIAFSVINSKYKILERLN